MQEKGYGDDQVSADKKAMNRLIAERLVQAMKRLDLALGAIDEIVDRIDDDAERKRIRRVVGTLILDAHEGITLEAVRQYPDLHPDRPNRE